VIATQWVRATPRWTGSAWSRTAPTSIGAAAQADGFAALHRALRRHPIHRQESRAARRRYREHGRAAFRHLPALFPETEIALQHCNAKTIVIPAMLPNKGLIIFRQRVQPNQLSLITREGEQFRRSEEGSSSRRGMVEECSEYGLFLRHSGDRLLRVLPLEAQRGVPKWRDLLLAEGAAGAAQSVGVFTTTRSVRTHHSAIVHRHQRRGNPNSEQGMEKWNS